jgi:hypothetical protein
MRGDKSFAYDLIVRYGPVSSRVALLLRSAEGKPPSTRFVYITLSIYWSLDKGLRRSHEVRNEGKLVPKPSGSFQNIYNVLFWNLNQ